MNQPTGTVTLLFTDIEGSTKLWENHSEAMRLALARHDGLIRVCIEKHGGYVFKTIGDAFCAAFPTVSDAISAALEAQRGLTKESWPDGISLNVRMALHTGAVESRDKDYFGPPLNRVARLLSAGHGAQVLLSHDTVTLGRGVLPEEVTLRDLGQHQLKDLSQPEHVYQLQHPDLPAIFPPIKSLSTHPNNLPEQVTSFIGRVTERAEAQDRLTKTKLLTLTGAGGSGKSRLGLQVAAEALERFPDGVFLVELAPLTDPAFVAPTVAGVLGVKEESGKPFITTLTEYLKEKTLLLLIDNCEHVLDASATLIATLLRACPHIQILATSREGLGIMGEMTYRIPSLSTPTKNEPATVATLMTYEAAQLFIARATLHRSDFAVTDQNAPALASICTRLDGIPLAIELAAARVRSLSVEEINDKLDQRFRLLTGGSRTALPRQQTLRSLIDWSYDLLSTPEKHLLEKLSVFVGGWTLEAAEAVCVGEDIDVWEVLDHLTSLVDKNLVIYETPLGGARYRLLETIRQYARDRLLDSGRGDTVRHQHCDYFLGLAERAEPELNGAEQTLWLQRLEAENENLRAGLEWSLQEIAGDIDSNDDRERALRFCGALSVFWSNGGYLTEGREWCQLALENHATRTRARAAALSTAATLAGFQGDHTWAKAVHAESLSIFRERGERGGIVRALNGLGTATKCLGDFVTARDCYEECLTLHRQDNNKNGIAAALSSLGFVARDLSDWSAARSNLEQAIALFREVGSTGGVAIALQCLGTVVRFQGDYALSCAYLTESATLYGTMGNKWGMALAVNALGISETLQGEYDKACHHQEESLSLNQEMGNKEGLLWTLTGFCLLAIHTNASEIAVTLWGFTETLRDELNMPLPPAYRTEYDEKITAIRDHLGDKAFQASYGQGRSLTLAQAISFALAWDKKA
jgi:predicted ATPase/class 3 adenylate cyclase